VHGGTTTSDIVRKVREAVDHAEYNAAEFDGMQTVLFFDEANTTEDIGLIKEIMCDHTIRGEQLMETHGLKLIAACNPYRKWDYCDNVAFAIDIFCKIHRVWARELQNKPASFPSRVL